LAVAVAAAVACRAEHQQGTSERSSVVHQRRERHYAHGSERSVSPFSDEVGHPLFKLTLSRASFRQLAGRR
jgi:hypothetical protein